MAYYTLDDVTQGIVDYLTTNIGSISGLNAVVYGDKKITPTFPACYVVGQELNRRWEGTHQVRIQFNLFLYVITAKLSQAEANRQKADSIMAQTIVSLLDSNRTLGSNIVDSLAENVQYGVLGRVTGGEAMVGFRITWIGHQKKVIT